MKYQILIFLFAILAKVSIIESKIKSQFKQISAINSPLPNSIGFNNNKNLFNRQATSIDFASKLSVIPFNHPVFTDFKRPKYVEKLHFYEDDPPNQLDNEAIALNTTQDTYYNPKMNNLYGLSSKKYTNCEDIRSSFVCESTKNLCGWEKTLNTCIYLNSASQNNVIRFKQGHKNLRSLKEIHH